MELPMPRKLPPKLSGGPSSVVAIAYLTAIAGGDFLVFDGEGMVNGKTGYI
jgi:hypothetical protein